MARTAASSAASATSTSFGCADREPKPVWVSSPAWARPDRRWQTWSGPMTGCRWSWPPRLAESPSRGLDSGDRGSRALAARSSSRASATLASVGTSAGPAQSGTGGRRRARGPPRLGEVALSGPRPHLGQGRGSKARRRSPGAGPDHPTTPNDSAKGSTSRPCTRTRFVGSDVRLDLPPSAPRHQRSPGPPLLVRR